MAIFPNLFNIEVKLHSEPVPLSLAAELAVKALGLTFPPTLENAVAKRKSEFLAGRLCAHEALKKAGWDAPRPFELGIRDDRAPLWPAGWVGALSHDPSMAAAAVARARDRRGIGLDVEVVMPEKQAAKVRAKILTDDEWSALRGTEALSDAELVTLIFSAKESVYKALRPTASRFFGFHEAKIIRIDRGSGAFEFALTGDIGGGYVSGYSGTGRFELSDARVYTALEVR